MGQKESKNSLSKSNCGKETFEKKHKYFSIYFEDVDIEFSIKTSPRLSFEDFKIDFRKFFKIPAEMALKDFPNLKMSENIAKSQTLEEDSFNEKSINSGELPQMVIVFEDPSDYICEIEIMIIRSKTIEYLPLKSMLFFPLKFFLQQDYFRDLKCKLFRHTDSLFSDPLDIEKNLLFYGYKSKKVVLLAYIPHITDFLQISIYFKGNIFPKNVEKFLRIGEIQENFNRENNCFVVLCNKDSGLRIDDRTTLGQISRNNIQMIFVAEEVEDYYRNVNVVSEKPVFEILSGESKRNKKHSIDLPD